MGWTVAIGVDTHRDTHLAVALGRCGGLLGSIVVATDTNGYLSLWEWAQGLGEPVFAIEGSGSYGAGLGRFLVAAAALVYECERPRRTDRRKGKSDLIDATLAARCLLSSTGLARLRGGGAREDLRLLLLERRGAVQARTAAVNQLLASVVTAPDPLRARFRGLKGHQAAKVAAKLRERADETTIVRRVLRRLAVRTQQLTREIDELEQELETIVNELVPELLDECGVGPACAAQLVVSTGDPTQMVSEASFAALAGTSPVQASSGQHQRHRLNRALHVIALHRVRWHPETTAYNQKLLASGKTPRDARRCIKRTLARHFYRQLQPTPTPALTQ